MSPGRHARPCAGHPRLFVFCRGSKASMAGTSPAMTSAICHCEEQRDEAIQSRIAALNCFAELVIGAATSGRTCWLATTKEETSRLQIAMSADKDNVLRQR